MKNIITNYRNLHGWKTSTSAESQRREILKHTQNQVNLSPQTKTPREDQPVGALYI